MVHTSLLVLWEEGGYLVGHTVTVVLWGVLIVGALHCKPGEVYTRLITATCEAGPGTTHMCRFEICVRSLQILGLLTDVSSITLHMASQSVICTLK